MPEAAYLASLVTRERQSRELALESGDVSVRAAHVAMADDYAQQILSRGRKGPAAVAAHEPPIG